MKLEAWAVGITAGSREVPGRKVLWQRHPYRIIIIIIIDSYTRNITHNTESAAVWSLKRERWGSLLVQEKYREGMPVTETSISYNNNDDDNNNNNNNNNNNTVHYPDQQMHNVCINIWYVVCTATCFNASSAGSLTLLIYLLHGYSLYCDPEERSSQKFHLDTRPARFWYFH